MKKIFERLIILILLFIVVSTSMLSADSSFPNINNFLWNETYFRWVKYLADEMDHAMVHCSTNSTVKIIDNDANGSQVAEVMQTNLDNVSITTYSLVTASFLYGFDGTDWSRPISSTTAIPIATSDIVIYTAGLNYGYDDDDTQWERVDVNHEHEFEVETTSRSVMRMVDEIGTNFVDVTQTTADDFSTSNYAFLARSLLHGFDGTDWDRLTSSSTASDIPNTNIVLQVAGLTYGWNGTVWVKALANHEDEFVAETSTRSATKLYSPSGNYAEIDSNGNLRVEIYGNTIIAEVDPDHNLHVETSTDSTIQLIDEDNEKAEITALADNIPSTNAVIMMGMNYAYNEDGDNWDRVEINHEREMKVVTSTESYINAIQSGAWNITALLEPATFYLIDSSGRIAEMNHENELKVTVSTTSAVLNDIKEAVETMETWDDSGNAKVEWGIENSTYVCKQYFANGNLVVEFNVKSIAVESRGGNTTLNWDSGDDMIIFADGGFDDVPIDETFDTPVTFNFTLAVPTTFQIYIRGKLAQ